MLQELLDKIFVVVASLFASEAVCQTVQHATGPETSLLESEFASEKFSEKETFEKAITTDISIYNQHLEHTASASGEAQANLSHSTADDIAYNKPKFSEDKTFEKAITRNESVYNQHIENKASTSGEAQANSSDCPADDIAYNKPIFSGYKTFEKAITTDISTHNPAHNQHHSESTASTLDLSGSHFTSSKNNGKHSDTNTDYGAIPIPEPNQQRKEFFSSCKTSLLLSCQITICVVPVSLVMILVLYFDVNTSSICFQHWMNNKSLPQDVMKYVITGHDIEGMALNFWFQLTLILLFGWREFRRNHFSTLLLGFLLGLSVVVYKTTLFWLKIDFTQTKYRYPGNAIFLFGVIYSSYLVAKEVSQTFSFGTNRLKKRKVFAIVSTQFFLGFIIAMAYRYSFIVWFRGTNSDILRTIIAMITPMLILLPMVISENLAIRSLQFTDKGRIFVLVYFLNGVSILLYCIMQAGVNSLRLFIVLSVFRGVLQVFQTATVKIRQKIVIGIWKCFQRKCISCPHVGELNESSHQRRLKVDKEIQIMLYQSAAIIISQAYLVFYLTSNYHVKTREILQDFIMKRIIIGIGISFVANCLSLLIHIHYHKTQITEIWLDHWKLHLVAVTLGGVMSICYFTAVLLSVFETFAHSKHYRIKNCTGPFS